jgi:hypothetical protein
MKDKISGVSNSRFLRHPFLLFVINTTLFVVTKIKGDFVYSNAIKLARKFIGSKTIISFDRGFHERTLLAMSLTSKKVNPYKFGFGPFAPDTYTCDTLIITELHWA